VPNAFASTIMSQLFYDTTVLVGAGGGTNALSQGLGDNLVGIPGYVQLKFQNSNYSLTGYTLTMNVYASKSDFETNVNNAIYGISATPVNSSTDVDGFATFSVATTTAFSPSLYYALVFTAPSGNGLNLFKASSLQFNNSIIISGTTSHQAGAFYFIVGTPEGIPQYFSADPSYSGFSIASSSTLASTCAGFSTTTSLLGEIASGVSQGFCQASSFLFVPSASSLNSFSQLPLRTVIPFSYFTDVYDIVTGASASSTENFPVYSIGLSQIDFSSSTPIGPLLPSSLTFLISTTISRYLPAGMHDTMFFLAEAAIWVTVMFHLYHRIRPKRAHI